MKISNEVVVEAAPETVFGLITDAERVAPCLPGASLQGRDRSDGDAYAGAVKVKVGPISAVYRGTVRYLSVDDAAHRVVLDARGHDEKGSGNAEARIEVAVSPDTGATGSLLRLDADLVVRGKVAQFGRGVLGDVSQQLMAQFARNIGDLLADDRSGPDESTAASGAEPGDRADVTGAAGAASGLDGLALVARPLLGRAVPVAAGLLVGVLLGFLGRAAVGGARARMPGRVLRTEDLVGTLTVNGTRVPVPVRRTIRVRPARPRGPFRRTEHRDPFAEIGRR